MKSGTFISTNIGCEDKAHQYDKASTQPAGRLRWWLSLMFGLLICGLSAIAQRPAQPASAYLHSRNVSSCGYDLGDCNEALLTPSEAGQVIAIQRRLNITACGYGYGRCNQGILTPSESAEVSLIRHRRNVSACGHGLNECSEDLLTPTETTLVLTLKARQADMQSRPLVLAARKPSVIVPAPAAVHAPSLSLLSPFVGAPNAPTAAPVAENGSYYGQPNKNGVPKIVQVQGYTRANGTYVQGYYRSAPGTNPIK